MNHLIEFSKTTLLAIAISIIAFLTLLSPCSVRNLLYSSLEIPIQKQLNPPKRILTDSDCHYSVESITAESRESTLSPKLVLFVCVLFFYLLNLFEKIDRTNRFIQVERRSQKVPPYILYKRLKISLS